MISPFVEDFTDTPLCRKCGCGSFSYKFIPHSETQVEHLRLRCQLCKYVKKMHTFDTRVEEGEPKILDNPMKDSRNVLSEHHR